MTCFEQWLGADCLLRSRFCKSRRARKASPISIDGKSIDLDIGYSVGGGYDLYARLIARRLGGHIPGNPTIVPKNMEGAGSLRLANYLYAAAPNDGTVIGATSRGAAFDPLLGETGAQFDASKFSWIGSANNEVSVCVASSVVGHHEIRRSAYEAADDRLDRHRRRHLPVPGFGQRGARHQDSRSSPAILAATTSASRSSAARCRAAAAGRGRASRPRA